MKKITFREQAELIKKGKPLIFVDEFDEIAYDFSNPQRLRVKRKGHEIFERERMKTNSETRALCNCMLMTPEEFENY